MSAKPQPQPAEETSRSRYPGTRPFSDKAPDLARYFGRDDAAEQLYLRVLSVPLLVQFGKSGLGKTSLLQAGLFPRLRKRAYLPVMIRLNDRRDSLLDATLRSMEESCQAEKLEFTAGDRSGVWELLATTTIWRDDLLLTPVLVFDQFEEVFTLRDAPFRKSLADELGALATGAPPARPTARQQSAKPSVKIVISLREDYVGALEELSASIPGLFHEFLRLGSFTETSATDAIVKPAALIAAEGEEPYRSPRFQLDDDALKNMLAYLKGKSGVIEPFQLQLLCRHAEGIARSKDATRDGIVTVTEDDFKGRQSFASVLQNFYRDTLAKIPSSRQRNRARRLCEDGLLGESGQRLMVEEEEVFGQYRLSSDTLTTLCGEHLLSREPRLDSVFYEISHDRLAESIFAARGPKLSRGFKLTLWAAAVVATVIIGTLLFVGNKINNERRTVRKERDSADRLIGFLLGEKFLGEIRDTGRSDLLESVRDKVAEAGAAERDPLNRALAQRNEGDIASVNGNTQQSVDHYRKALQSFDPASDNAVMQREAARTHERLGDALLSQGHHKESLEHFQAAEKAWRSVISGRPCANMKADCVGLARVLVETTITRRATGDANLRNEWDEAFDLIAEVLFGAPGLTGTAPLDLTPYPDSEAIGVLALLENCRNDAYSFFEDSAGASALAVASSSLRPQSVQARLSMLYAIARRGADRLRVDPRTALDDYREVVRLGEELRRWDPKNRTWEMIWAETHLLISNIIVLCLDQKTCQAPGTLADAEAGTLDALAHLRALFKADPTNVQLRNDVVWALQIHAAVLGQKGLHNESLLPLQEAEHLFGTQPPEESDALSAIDHAGVLRDLANRYLLVKDMANAGSNLQQSTKIIGKLLGIHPDNAQLIREMHENVVTEAQIQERSGNTAAAASLDLQARRLEAQFNAIGQTGAERDRLKNIDRQSRTAASKDSSKRLENLLKSETAARQVVRLAPADPDGYENLQIIFNAIAVQAQQRKESDRELVALNAAMNAAQLASWLTPEATPAEKRIRKNRDAVLLQARTEVARYLYRVNRKPESLAMTQEVIPVAERLAEGPTPDPRFLALLGRAQWNLGEIRYSLSTEGWEESFRSGILRIETAATIAKDATLWKKSAEWHRSFSHSLEETGRRADAKRELDASTNSLRQALALKPHDPDVSKELKEVESAIAKMAPP